MSHAAYDPRCRISVDDTIWCLRDVALHAKESIFENGFLRFWKDLHEDYGAQVQFNIYYEDLDTGWTIAEMPDRFRAEWQACSEWLRLTFHARADRPNAPYASADYATVDRDMRMVTEQIVRFAGESSLSSMTTIHWGAATREGCRALRDNGIDALAGYFEIHDGKPYVAYYHDVERTAYIGSRDMWRDDEAGLLFVKLDLVLNLITLSDVIPRLEEIRRRADESEVLELMIHEQFFYPRYCSYQPDAAQKVVEAARWARERGYRWAFYEEWRAEY